MTLAEKLGRLAREIEELRIKADKTGALSLRPIVQEMAAKQSEFNRLIASLLGGLK